MEMYLDGAVYGDPLQHGDIMSSCQGVTRTTHFNWEHLSEILQVDERHHYSDVKRVLRWKMSLDDRLVVDLIPDIPEPGVLLVVQGGGHLHLLPHPPPHLLVVGSVVAASLHCKSQCETWQ